MRRLARGQYLEADAEREAASERFCDLNQREHPTTPTICVFYYQSSCSLPMSKENAIYLEQQNYFAVTQFFFKRSLRHHWFFSMIYVRKPMN
jgi:hypothetical protein